MKNCFPEEVHTLAELEANPKVVETEVKDTQRLEIPGQGVFVVNPDAKDLAELFDDYKEAKVFIGDFTPAKEGAPSVEARLDIDRPSLLKTLSSKALRRTVATKVTVTDFVR